MCETHRERSLWKTLCLHQPSVPRDVQETKQINPGGHTIYVLGNTSCHQWNSSTKLKNELLQTGQFMILFCKIGNSSSVFTAGKLGGNTFPCARNDVSLSLRFLRANLDVSSSSILEQSELSGNVLRQRAALHSFGETAEP